MRLIQRVERSFIAKIVNKTRQLVHHSGSTALKVAVLRHWAHRQAQKAEKLEARVDGPSPEKLQHLAMLRRRAAGYLDSTAKFLRNQQEHPLGLRQMPNGFAVANWEQDDNPKEKDDEPEFMEFSS